MHHGAQANSLGHGSAISRSQNDILSLFAPHEDRLAARAAVGKALDTTRSQRGCVWTPCRNSQPDCQSCVIDRSRPVNLQVGHDQDSESERGLSRWCACGWMQTRVVESSMIAALLRSMELPSKVAACGRGSECDRAPSHPAR